MPIEADFIYSAGVIDSDGNICISRCNRKRMINPSYSTHVHVCNTNPELIKYFKETFGGSVNYWDGGNPKHKPSIYWNLYGEDSREFLLGVLPFMKIKHEQARLAIYFQEEMNMSNKNGTNNRITSNSLDIREDLYQKCASLNKRGRLSCHTA